MQYTFNCVYLLENVISVGLEGDGGLGHAQSSGGGRARIQGDNIYSVKKLWGVKGDIKV